MKDKYLQIFNYLLEFSKIRDRSIKNIETAKTNYIEILWMKDIPNNNDIDYILNENYNKNADYFLRITKPVEPIKPEFPEPPPTLKDWIDPTTLLNRNDLPELLKEITIDEEINILEENPDIIDEFEKYCEDYWLQDSENYWVKRDIYDNDFQKFEKTNNIYKKLFSVYNKTKQFGEEFELIMGVGLFYFQESEDTPLICRHIITTKTDIEFEFTKKNSNLIVSQNLLNTLQIETDSIIDLFDQFDSDDIIEAEKLANEFIKEKELINPFDKELHDVLQLLAERIKPGDGNYYDVNRKPTQIPIKETVFFAPALILRKRNTKSFTSLYEKIISDIKEEEIVDIPMLDDLTESHNKESGDPLILDSVNHISEEEPIYFPKEWNDEQIEIVNKTRRNNKILVQGPPGTGKSHTIANLICHLLANGKKLLITAYTKRALEVLKDKLPEEFKDLVVNLLSGDASSIKDLQSSVNSINDELSRANLDEYKNEIIELDDKLKAIREKIAINTNELIKIKEKDSRKQEINSSYSGTLTEIAEILELDSVKFEWYKDSFCDINNTTIATELKSFIEQYESYKTVDLTEFDYYTLKVENLPTSDELKQYYLDEEKLSKLQTSSGHLIIKCSYLNDLRTMLSSLHDTYKQISMLQIDFTDKIIGSYFKGNAYQWKQKLETSTKVLSRLEQFDFEKIDRDIEITYNSKNSLKQLKSDAQILIKYLNEGNPLSGFVFNLKKQFLTKEIKERLYFVNDIRVNGGTTDTLEKIKTAIRDIELQQDFENLKHIWDKKGIDYKSYKDIFLNFKNINNEVNKLLTFIDESEKLRLQIEKNQI